MPLSPFALHVTRVIGQNTCPIKVCEFGIFEKVIMTNKKQLITFSICETKDKRTSNRSLRTVSQDTWRYSDNNSILFKSR